MKAVVLATGRGTRLRPFTHDKPKALGEVDGRPILSHCFDELVNLDADASVVVVGYRKDRERAETLLSGEVQPASEGAVETAD